MIKNNKQQTTSDKSNKIFIFSFILLVSCFLFLVSIAHAQYGFTDFLNNAPGQQLGIEWLFNLLNNFVCYFYQFAIIVLATMLVIYGIMFLKSRGNPQGMTDARKALAWGLVGGLVIFAVFTIIMSVASFLGTDTALIDSITCQ